MKQRIIRNSSYTFRDTTHSGRCPRFNEKATLSIHLNGKQIAKTDLHATFSCRLMECSLLKEKSEKDTTCVLECSLLKEYKNGHNF